MLLTRADSSEHRPDADGSLHRSPPATPASFYRGRFPLLLTAGCVFAIPRSRRLRPSGLAATSVGPSSPALRATQPHGRAHQVLPRGVVPRFDCRSSEFERRARSTCVASLPRRQHDDRHRRVRRGQHSRFVLKNLVGRQRPDLGRLVEGTGYSFPSGHVLAAIALYGLIPLVVALCTRNRFLWWASCALSGFVVVAVAACRSTWASTGSPTSSPVC